jgi:hypothetical protein
MLPITRAELVLDSKGYIALNSDEFLAVAPTIAADGSITSEGHPGLMTAAEKAMLNGAGNQNISDVYVKLGHINSGLRIDHDGTTGSFAFYNANGVATPITIKDYKTVGTAKVNSGIVITKDSNSIHLGLREIHSKTVNNETVKGLKANGIIKSITVDEYGRVTGVSGSNLTNDEIPGTLSGKTLSGCTASEPTTSTGIATKGYVDKVVTSALSFKGSLASTLDATNALIETNVNGYYKVTSSFILSANQVHGSSENVSVVAGDTLIVHKEGDDIKYVHIPSGDDITTITVSAGTLPSPFQNKISDVELNFSNLFTVASSAATPQIVNIGLHKATNSQDGYLS